MGDPTKGRTRRWTVIVWWLIAALIPGTLASLAVAWILCPTASEFFKLGLLQPVLAAGLALSVVLCARVALGRFVNDRRKGVLSASSATIAVRLWALCFALLVGAMLLSALVARLPEELLARTEAEPKAETNSAGVPPAVKASVEVTR